MKDRLPNVAHLAGDVFLTITFKPLDKTFSNQEYMIPLYLHVWKHTEFFYYLTVAKEF